LCLELLRPGGLLLADNTLWSGRVVDPGDHEASTEAIRRFNRRLHDDERISLSLLPVGDGLTLALKKSPAAESVF
jgi:predicted O-methyltransferase YrrM